MWWWEFDLEIGLCSFLYLSIGNSLELGSRLHCSWSVGQHYTHTDRGFSQNRLRLEDLSTKIVVYYSDDITPGKLMKITAVLFIHGDRQKGWNLINRFSWWVGIGVIHTSAFVYTYSMIPRILYKNVRVHTLLSLQDTVHWNLTMMKTTGNSGPGAM